MCRQDRAGEIIMSVQHHLDYHSHYTMMWGYPGNIMKIKFRVTCSSGCVVSLSVVPRVVAFAEVAAPAC
jgi:hypothetical protein